VRLGRLKTAATLAVVIGTFGLLTTDARASSDDAVTSAQGELAQVGANMAGVQAAMARVKTERESPEKRLVDGQQLYAAGEHTRAILVFSELMEEFPTAANYADALWYRGESYYAAHDYLSARRDYKALVDRSSEPSFQRYMGKALARQVDVVLRMEDPASSVSPIVDKLNQVPPGQIDAGLLYAKGKAYFLEQAWNDASAAFNQVANGSPYTHQARYFSALVTLKLARPAVIAAAGAGAKPTTPPNYKPAIDAFHAVTDLPPDTPEHKHVIDLAWMAIARLFYETEQYQRAAAAYGKIDRSSPEFDTMLYELAWDYVRMGDTDRADRALDLLMVADPNSTNIGDGTLLRADLLLRSGSFDRALALYQSVLSQFEPMRAKVQSFLDSTKDVSVYYEKLARQQLDLLDQNDALPALAIRWAREAEDGPMAFAVIDSVNECKKLIKDSNRLMGTLGALVGASNRVRAFPELEAGEQMALSLVNRVSRARLTIAKELDSEEPSDLGGEIGQVRQQRRALMASIADLPVDVQDFARREEQGQEQWTNLSHELSYRLLEVDQLHAAINGVKRLLSDAPQQGIARDPATVQRFQAEIEANEADIKRYYAEIADLRSQLDMGRAQIGLGDARYQHDAVARGQFRDLLEREVQLASGGAAGGSAQRFSGPANTVLLQARQYEDQLNATLASLEAQIAQRAAGMMQKIEAERANMARFEQQLDGLDGEAHDLVGHVAQRNLGLVRDRLRNIVLRGDVGITEQAWEVREEELYRVHRLQAERARQEELLDEELKEVRDDGVETQPSQTGK
jgi:tetratricopeptide (TPR) repeat protein